jgi:hypothetical protein
VRKARPLERSNGEFRDTKLFLVGTDDRYAPKQYFEFFQFPNVQVRVIETPHGAPGHAWYALERLLEFDFDDDDERWLVVDADHFIKGTHLKEFVAALQRARQLGVKVALSRPCFEFWLLLHHWPAGSATEGLSDAGQVAEALRGVLGEFNKTRLKREHFSLGKLAEAVRRARELDRVVEGNEIPLANTTRVYLLVEAVLRGLPERKVPVELRGLV